MSNDGDSSSLLPPPGFAPAARLDAAQAAEFRTTHWSIVLQAGGRGELSAPALEKLCRGYWAPLYAFVRRQGHNLHAAQDLTQEFFARLLADNSLANVHPDKGRFRSFLLASMKHFLANEWNRSQARKRGGGCEIFSLDQANEEEGHGFEPAGGASPDRLFERRWAETVLARVNARLRREYEAAGQGDRFDALKIYLLADYDPVSYADTAARLGLTESAVKSAIYKLRQRYGEMFRAEIAHTVGRPEDVEEEIQHLLRALGE
jgi:RNA polymerase sigma-70 factor (ECF subfamily)